MILKKKDIVDELSKRTKFYKNSTERFVSALEDMIIEYLNQAEVDDNVEIQIAKGLIIGSRRVPEHEAKDPRNQDDVIVPERVLPYARFTDTFKQKINE
jgi:nucleoid DNA-binding protein|nr:MAG TPA_asm: Bacterial DNA-binding protein [Caudoviricetes sp.]